MNLTNIYPELQKLSRTDKLKVMQFLITELVKEEEIAFSNDRNQTPTGINTDIWNQIINYK